MRRSWSRYLLLLTAVGIVGGVLGAPLAEALLPAWTAQERGARKACAATRVNLETAVKLGVERPPRAEEKQPASLDALVSAGLIPPPPPCPRGGTYGLIPATWKVYCSHH